MKRSLKKNLLIIVFIVIITFAFNISNVNAEIVEKDGNKYIYEEGILKTGLFNYKGKTYYANDNGVLQNRVQEVNGKKYFFGRTTYYMWKGMINDWGDMIVTNENGEVYTGLFDYEGKTYYANDNGVLQNEVQEIDGKKYFFGKTTYYMRKGWIDNWGDALVTNENGEVYTGLFEYDGKTYYANDNGVLQNEVQEIDGKKYFFGKTTYYMRKGWIDNWGDALVTNEEGELKTGLFEYKGKIYYANNNGILQRYIQEIEGRKYYFDPSSFERKTGWIKHNNKTYYANSDGQLVNTDQTIDGLLYRFNEDCSLKSGWQGNSYILEDGSKATGWKIITGKKYFFNQDGEMMGEDVKKVIDVSSWQDTINWEQVKNDGVDGAIIRVGWGMTSYDAPGTDSKFAYNISEVKRLNIPYALYIYGYAEYDFSARNEAKFVKEMMEKYGIPKNTYVFYDAEEPIPVSTYSLVIPTFVETMHNYGYKNVGVYGSISYFEYGRLNSDSIKQYPIWVAQYYKRNQYEGNYVGWQYCSDGRINGINGNVDVNMFKISF